MGLGALAAEVTFFDVFFGVVPGTTTRAHRDGDEQARDDGADEQTTERADAGAVAHQRVHAESHHDRHQDRQQRGHYHLLDRRFGEQVDRGGVIGLARTVHDAGDLAELATHFGDHRARCSSDGFHGHRSEQVGHETTDEEADDHGRIR